MTEVRPFRASVVRPEWAARVVSPMHDSLTPEERAAIKAANPDSFLHVTRRAGDPDESDDQSIVAADGVAALDRLLDAGAFRSFPEADLFVYRIDVEGSAHAGLVAEVPVEAFKSGDVRGHEDVEPDRVEALSLHLEGVGASSDPVALMFRPNPEVARVLAEIELDEPVLRIGDDEVAQSVWRVDDPAGLQTVTARLAPEVMYVADGHHRVAASIAASERMEDPSQAAVLCVLYPVDELRVLAFHRLVIGPVDGHDLRSRLEERFLIEETDRHVAEPGSFAIRVNRAWLQVTARDTPRPPGVAGLDVTRLHHGILQPILGIADAGDPRLEVVPDTVSVDELAARVDASGGALFVLAAPPIDEILEVADRGEIVPPKSTYFLPKPMSGVFLRMG